MSDRFWHILKGTVPSIYFNHLVHIKIDYSIVDLIKGGTSVAFINIALPADLEHEDDVYDNIHLRLLRNISDEDRTYLILLGLELKEEIRPRFATLLSDVISSKKPYYTTHSDFRKLYYRSEMDKE